MLDDGIKTQLSGYFERLEAPIELVATLDTSDGGSEMRAFLEALRGLSPKLTVREDSTLADVRRPSFSVGRIGEASRIRFAGVPMGHEFTSFILAVLQASGYPPKVDAATVEAVRALPGPLHFVTYVSLTCQNCPDVVQALNLMAALNPGITHVMVDGSLYQDEVNARQVMAVPSVFANEALFGQGRMTLDEIVAKLDSGAEARAAATLAEKAPYDVLVVGGGPAGASAAIYAARKGIRTGIVSERFGGQVGDTLGIENFISIEYTEGPKLVAALESHVRSYGVDVVDLQRATATHPRRRGRPARADAGQWRRAARPERHPGPRRPLARDEGARRDRVPHQGRGVLSPLRRPPVQGQTRGGRRRWQLRRRGGHRPRRGRRPRHAARVRLEAARGRRAAEQTPQPEQRRGSA
jgi:alkyl hydroperoxide reductase subunit F